MVVDGRAAPAQQPYARQGAQPLGDVPAQVSGGAQKEYAHGVLTLP